MKIIVMSDSHGHNELVKEVIKREPDADYYLHCGDLCSDERNFPDVLFVEGNCDFNDDLPKYRVVDCGSRRIYMTHSDRMWDRKNNLIELAKKKKCEIVCYGHTHIPSVELYEGYWLVNPGALSYNRDGSEPGYCQIDISDNDIQITRKVL